MRLGEGLQGLHGHSGSDRSTDVLKLEGGGERGGGYREEDHIQQPN